MMNKQAYLINAIITLKSVAVGNGFDWPVNPTGMDDLSVLSAYKVDELSIFLAELATFICDAENAAS